MKKDWLLKKILKKSSKKTTVLDRVLLAILAVGFVLITVFVIYLVWFGITNRSVSHVLPAKTTAAYVELNDLSLPPSLGQQTALELIGADSFLEKTFELQTEEILNHFKQGRMGVALVSNEEGINQSILFFRVGNRKDALAFFQGLGLPGEELEMTGTKRQPIYSYPESHELTFSFIGPYLFVSKSLDVLEQVQTVYRGDAENLFEQEHYQSSVTNLPKQTWGRAYINVQSIVLGPNDPNRLLVDPLKHVVQHFSLAVRKEINGFHFNTLMTLNPQLLSLQQGFTDETRFTYGLSNHLSSKKLAAYIGGANLAAEWQNTLDTITSLNPAYGIILEGVLRSKVDEIFGEDVSLRNDLYPLFEEEYALSMESGEEGQLGVKLILKHHDREFAEVKLEKLAQGFETLATKFSPRKKTFLLPDGTEATELVADDSKLEEHLETYGDANIRCMAVSETAYGFCYTLTDDLILLSNRLDSIKESIDLTTNPKFTLAQSQSFRQALSNLSAVSDEITYLKLDKLADFLQNTPVNLYVNRLSQNFDVVTWIKHYFKDGVSTEGFLLLK